MLPRNMSRNRSSANWSEGKNAATVSKWADGMLMLMLSNGKWGLSVKGWAGQRTSLASASHAEKKWKK